MRSQVGVLHSGRPTSWPWGKPSRGRCVPDSDCTRRRTGRADGPGREHDAAGAGPESGGLRAGAVQGPRHPTRTTEASAVGCHLGRAETSEAGAGGASARRPRSWPEVADSERHPRRDCRDVTDGAGGRGPQPGWRSDDSDGRGLPPCGTRPGAGQRASRQWMVGHRPQRTGAPTMCPGGLRSRTASDTTAGDRRDVTDGVGGRGPQHG